MNDDIKPSSDGLTPQNKIVNPHNTIESIELEHGENKTASELADEAFKKDPEPLGKDMSKKKRKWFKRELTKKQKIIGLIVLVIIVAASAGASWWYLNRKPAPQASQPAAVKTEEPKPTTEPSKLTGREVAPEINKRQVTGVMIENSPDARPQSGLLDAGIVFEAIAEGGITRFLALYQDTQPDFIGPIRSARPYYLDWALPFDASLAHVGGSPDALSAIKTLGVKDLDQFAHAGAYKRVNNRFAPHNVYSSIAELNKVEQQKGYTTSTYTGFGHKKDAASSAPTAKSIDISPSSFLYNSHWDYDVATNSYKRSQANKPHTDEKSGQQLTAKTVIALVIAKGVSSDGYHTAYTSTGSGKVYVFQDGILTEGTWQKAGSKDQFKLIDAASKPIELNPGQTWITIVSAASQVAAKP